MIVYRLYHCFSSFIGSEPHLDATITSENILRILALMLSYLIVDHLYGCTSYLRGLFKEVQDSAFNLKFKLSFIVVFFWMVHNEKLFRRSSVNYWTFLEGPMWSDIFPLCMRMRKIRSCRKLSKYCSILGKNREIFGPHNFWTPMKSNIPDVWNWNFWALFGLEIELQEEGDRGWHYPLVIPVVTPLNIVTEKFKSGVICHNSFEHCHSTFENYIFCKFWFSRLVD